MAFQFDIKNYRSHSELADLAAQPKDQATRRIVLMLAVFAFGLAVGDLMRPNSYLGGVVLPKANHLVASFSGRVGH